MDCSDMQKIGKDYLVFFCNFKKQEKGYETRYFDVIVRFDYYLADEAAEKPESEAQLISYLAVERDAAQPSIAQNRVVFVPKFEGDALYKGLSRDPYFVIVEPNHQLHLQLIVIHSTNFGHGDPQDAYDNRNWRLPYGY